VRQEERTPRNSAAQAKHLDRLLDSALAETFPASDPVAICSEDPVPERAPQEPAGSGRSPVRHRTDE
jgi:hypothetical protein